MEREKRDAIVEAAKRAFIEHGYKGANIEQISRKAGVAKGTVYLACESKADLFYQAVHSDLQAWSANVARAVDPRRGADEILIEMAESGVRYLAAHPLVQGLMAGIHRGFLPDWADRFEELRALGRASVAQVLTLGIRQGVLRPDLDVEETAALLQDIQHSGYINHGERWAQSPELATRRVRATLELVLNGLRVRKVR